MNETRPAPETTCDYTVLVVDDDDVALEGVLRSFRRHGVPCRSQTAGDGCEALDVLRGRHPAKQLATPVIVLLDLNMPNMDGFQFLEALRADPELKRTVVFILSTSAREQDRSRAYDEHVAGYMVKSAVGPQFAQLAQFITKYATTQNLP
ncbi:response regulator [Novosphingobium aerophilum]|uniref:response regulator n=1 Tax=Novosphingobium TaxID=165696 RepID=UPI0006C8C3DE|nr:MULTISPECIES: response regulator [unclassified Novosphingobium]KPH64806.1 chemotaxis protein CheY [Novosphingobium sp. ST904]MPS69880.1 response regulator [Novosphingobium sp.]TCM34514.1 response regulator receiver domain-containing protein [Novosphingobium sp. ST904]WRT92437.1 response regulator [Novosphingobium sp. RL4]